MTTLIRRILLIIVGLCIAAPLSAQTMSVFSTDASGFPTIKAKIIVADKKEQSIRNFSSGDFVVTENGKPVSGVNVNCPPLQTKSCVNVVLVIDQSLSMMEVLPPDYTVTRLEAVKAGALTFLQTIEFTPPTVVALTSFDRYAYILNDFSGSRLPLESKVQGITPNGDIVGTNYGAGLADPFYGAIPLLQQRSKQCPRVIVFLTDGMPYNPDFYPDQADSILKVLKQDEIQLYAISIGTDNIHPLLKKLAEESGGTSFVKENPTIDELKGIYKRIAEQVQGGEPCTLSWQADLGCGDASKLRKVEVRYQPMSVKAADQYTAPEASVAQLKQSASILAFGTPAVNSPVTKQLKLTARNYPFVVSKASFEPANPYFQVTDWGGSTPQDTIPFTLQPGEERTLTVTFTQLVNQQYRAANLMLTTSPCQIDPIAVWGGAPPAEGSPIRLFAPNGDRDLSICDTTTITWGGIPEYLPVQISYSTDNGSTWEVIKNNVTGDHFVWQPSKTTNDCVVKVETLKDFLDWKWALREGDLDHDRALGIGIDGNNYSYVVGEHMGTIMVDTFELKKSPIFLARYTPEGGVVWARDIGKSSIDIAVSRDGDSYVLGKTSITKYKSDSTQLWSVSYPLYPRDTLVDIALDGTGNCWVGGTTTVETGGPVDDYELFIRKYNSAGAIQPGAVSRKDAKLYAITADLNGNAIAFGYFLGKKGDLFGGAPLDPGYFLVKFDNAGRQLWVKNTDDIRTTALACDKDDNIFQTGWFTATRRFGSISVTTGGNEDLYVAKYKPDGTVLWVKTAGVAAGTFDFGVDVSTDSKGNCYVTGVCEKAATRVNLRMDGVEAEPKGKKDVFVAKLTPTGTVEWLNLVGGSKDDSVSALAVDPVGRCYIAGSIEETAGFGMRSITSHGMKDVSVACLTVIPAGSDISDSAFAVEAPKLTVKENPLDLGEIAVGQITSRTISQVVCNTGTLPVHITKTSIVGANKDDFQLISSLNNVTIEPGDCRALEIAFKPSAVGNRTADFLIESECIDPVSTPVVGKGLNPCLLEYTKELHVNNSDVGVPLQTTFANALHNTGTETIEFTISIFGPGRAAYRLVSPATASLNPGDYYTLVVEFTPSQAGDADAAYVSYTSECGSLVADLFGKGVPVPPVIEGSETYCGDLMCMGDQRDTLILIRNLGKTDLQISNVALSKGTEGFTILSWPAKIAPQKVDTVRVRFAPTSVGFKIDDLIVTSNASNEPVYRIPVSGKLLNVSLDFASTLNFGTVAPRDLPTTQTITIRNNGDAEIEITAASFSLPMPFTIVSGVPVVLKPDSSAVIEIEFGNPGVNGEFSSTLALTCEPTCTPYSIAVTGRRSAAEAVLSIPELTADPHDRNFHIPIKLVAGGDFSQAQGRKFTISVCYNDALFFVKSCSNGEIVRIDTLDKRVCVTITGTTPSSGNILTELIGDVLLGDTVETPIEVTVVSWEDVVGVVEKNGKLVLINTTDKEGLERLIRDRGRLLGIRRVAPNPANTEAKVYVNTVEIGEHALEVYDSGGRRIYRAVWTETGSTLIGEDEITLPTERFPVGSYNLVLKTPTRTAEGRLVVIR